MRSPEDAPDEFRARPGDWARVWLLLHAERVFTYAAEGAALD